MLQRVYSPDFTDSQSARACATPEAMVLIEALEGCRHPKAERLLTRLAHHPDCRDIVCLRYDVLELLTLAFGKAEALRRLQ